ncbi:MAG: ArsC/Spx/MgsR family protein [Flavobacteriales bacterium]
MNVYHNPSCSKSRICLDELTSKDMTFEVIHYLKNPLNRAELTSLLKKLDMNPSELVRKNEVIFKEAAKIKELTEEEILQLMLDYPKLIQRPIVEVDGKAIVARPIERLAAFLTSIK